MPIEGLIFWFVADDPNFVRWTISHGYFFAVAFIEFADGDDSSLLDVIPILKKKTHLCNLARPELDPAL